MNLPLEDPAALGDFLVRLLRYDKAAVVRLRADGTELSVYGHAPFGRTAGRTGVITVRRTKLATPAFLDATVSAGQLLDDPAKIPSPVVGPAWTGLLPPTAGWADRRTLPAALVAREVAAAVSEFRHRIAHIPDEERTRTAVDSVADEIWDRELTDTGLPLRAAHAAQSLGLLGAPGPQAATLAAAGPWLRLDGVHGAAMVRAASGTSLLVR